jgi:hypothetical protein
MASGALAELRRRYAHLDEDALHRELKIGTVFFAVADVDLRSFVREDLEAFYDLPKSIRITVSEGDTILGLSRTLHAGSRLGAPSEGALTHEDLDELTEMLPKLDSIWVTYADEGRDGGDFGGHGYWYQNPWVSTDVLISLRADVPPDRRGLKWIEGTRSWYFPNDYPQRVADMVRAYRKGEFVRDERPENSAIQEILQSEQ